MSDFEGRRKGVGYADSVPRHRFTGEPRRPAEWHALPRVGLSIGQRTSPCRQRRGDLIVPGEIPMLHYHVWFNLKPGVAEPEGLDVVRRFLAQLCEHEEAANFQLLRNSGGPPRSKLPRYHALIVFSDPEQLAAAMRKQVERGIHAGRHGEVIDVVTEFHVEIFTAVETPTECGAPALQACEI